MTEQYKPLVIVSGQVRELESSESLNATVTAKEIIRLTADSNYTASVGEAVYIDGQGKAQPAKADAAASTYPVGFVRGAADGGTIAAGEILDIQTDGQAEGFSNLTAGQKLYLSPSSAGDVTATAPNTANQYVVPVGRAISATDILVEIGEPIKLST